MGTLDGRYLSLPVGHADWEEKSTWFRSTSFRAARAAGFLPAIEWKGRPPTPEIAAEIAAEGVYWGIHAPNDFADQFRKGVFNKEVADFRSYMETVAPLRPGYVVVHGGLDSLIPMGEVPLDDHIERYKSPISGLEYELAKMVQFAFHAAMRRLMVDESVLLLENTSITEFVDGVRLPTYTHPRVGNWIDVGAIARASGAEPLCDIGHLQYSHNFFYREQDYAGLPFADGPDLCNPLHRAFLLEGLCVRKGEFPVYHHGARSLSGAIEKIDADFYHLEGGVREEENGKIMTHAPIEYGDRRIRGILRQILSRKRILICLEVDGSRPDGGGPFPDREPTEVLQRSSWMNLCRMAVEEAH